MEKVGKKRRGLKIALIALAVLLVLAAALGAVSVILYNISAQNFQPEKLFVQEAGDSVYES